MVITYSYISNLLQYLKEYNNHVFKNKIICY